MLDWIHGFPGKNEKDMEKCESYLEFLNLVNILETKSSPPGGPSRPRRIRNKSPLADEAALEALNLMWLCPKLDGARTIYMYGNATETTWINVKNS